MNLLSSRACLRYQIVLYSEDPKCIIRNDCWWEPTDQTIQLGHQTRLGGNPDQRRSYLACHVLHITYIFHVHWIFMDSFYLSQEWWKWWFLCTLYSIPIKNRNCLIWFSSCMPWYHDLNCCVTLLCLWEHIEVDRFEYVCEYSVKYFCFINCWQSRCCLLDQDNSRHNQILVHY